MIKIYSATIFLTFSVVSIINAQQKVGINTINPIRSLEVYGSGSQFMRIHTSTPLSSRTSLELIRGNNGSNARDWELVNFNGDFRIQTSTDNFSSLGTEMFRINDSEYVGIGEDDPVAKLHVNGGEDASNTLDGFILIGSKTGDNLVIDQNEIIARQNGSASTLYVQSTGGNTRFGEGNVFMGSGGKVSVGDAPLSALFNVNGGSYQVQFRNDADDVNDWYIGSSSSTWLTGDDYLLFSPTTGHLNSLLRLKNVTDNDGILAPVMITTSASQWLLLDGNEIDSKTSLSINANSNEETYINPSGGKVGVGSTNPTSTLHLNTDEQGLGLQRDFATWWITPLTNGNINFYKNTALLAYISYNGGGEWVAVSDRNLKENIQLHGPVMSKVNQLGLYSYNFIHDPTQRKDLGVIAQELEPLFPEAVSFGEDQYAVSYDQLTVIGIQGIQEQQVQIEAMFDQVDVFLEKLK